MTIPSHAWPTRGSRAATECVEWIHARTVPLYAQMRGGNPVLQGTGVLLKIANVGFVVSAAHVFADVLKDKRQLLVGSNSAVLPLDGCGVAISRDQEDVDSAFARLPDALTERIAQGKRFLELEQIDLAHAPPLPGWYTVFGFPRERTSRDDARRKLINDPFGLHTVLHDEDLRFDQLGTSITLSFEPQSSIDERGEVMRTPSLRGMSGCGIWCVATTPDSASDESWSTNMIRLAGIEHSVVGQRMVKGVLAFRVIVGIRQQYPELREATLAAGRAQRAQRAPRPLVFRPRQV